MNTITATRRVLFRVAAHYDRTVIGPLADRLLATA